MASTCAVLTLAPGSISPAASSTFFSLYSSALAVCPGWVSTAAVAIKAAHTTHTTVANSTV
jgi:hypothetical protein